jgi:hypothetical protein
MNSNDINQAYNEIYKILISKEFRNKIEEFIDQNCYLFLPEIEENTIKQGEIFNQFILLIENYLEKIIKELNISEEMFINVTRKGLENPKDKKYFGILISFTNYIFFKNLMIKRNIQLSTFTYNLLVKKNNKLNNEFDVKKKKMNEQEKICNQKIEQEIDKEKEKLKMKEYFKCKRMEKKKTIQEMKYVKDIDKKEESEKEKQLKEFREKKIRDDKEKREKELNQQPEVFSEIIKDRKKLKEQIDRREIGIDSLLLKSRNEIKKQLEEKENNKK